MRSSESYLKSTEPLFRKYYIFTFLLDIFFIWLETDSIWFKPDSRGLGICFKPDTIWFKPDTILFKPDNYLVSTRYPILSGLNQIKINIVQKNVNIKFDACPNKGSVKKTSKSRIQKILKFCA